MGLKVTNNAFGTLNAGINSSATTIVLTAGQGSRFPTLSAGDYFYATLIDTSNNLEIVKVTARSTDTMTVVRGQDNTTARAYSTNDRFELRPTAALFNEKANDADVAATYLAKSGGTMTGNLVVEKASDPRVRVKATDSSTAGLFIESYSSGSVVGSATVRVDSSGRLQFFNGTTAEQKNIEITAAGQVTKPYQVAWAAEFGGLSLPSASVVYYPSYNTPKINVGGHFNASTGRMTAPVSGIYLLMGSFLRNSNGYVYRGRFYKNGVVPMDGEYRNTEGFSGYNESSTFTHIISAAAGDTLAWGVSCDVSGQSLYTSGYNYFSGYLLG